MKSISNLDILYSVIVNQWEHHRYHNGSTEPASGVKFRTICSNLESDQGFKKPNAIAEIHYAPRKRISIHKAIKKRSQSN